MTIFQWIFGYFFGFCSNKRIKAGTDKKKKKEHQPPVVQNQPSEDVKMEPNTMLAHITAARGLYMKNKTSLEAFATVTLQGKGSLRSRCATEAMHTEGDCRWDEVCEFKLSDKFNAVVVSVHSKSKLGSGELIGRCELELENAKLLHGQTNWLRLKKKNSDEKYRGEVQIRLEFNYEKPSMSISSLSLNQLGQEAGGKEEKSGGGGLMSKMKRKITQAKNGHKKAEDTMSMASAWSATSKISTKSNKSKIFGKIGSKLGLGGKDKEKTLPPGTFLTPMDNHLDQTTNGGLYETANSSNGHGGGGSTSRNSRCGIGGNGLQRIRQHEQLVPPAILVLRRHEQLVDESVRGFNVSRSTRRRSSSACSNATSTDNTPTSRFGIGTGIGVISGAATLPHAMTSPVMSHHQEMFRRSGSIRSTASSGFGGSQKNHQKIIDPTNSDDLLAVIDSLKLELQVKDSRMKDMQGYMDQLISRVMERNPELLAAQNTTQKQSRMRFF
ncbi:Protein CBG23567 [Caenorhabditis briggsae]|uniref:Protein CBG23567 n=1 Tax=Caenorhabditis briggsae TaxID=6238 RepID=A8WIU8_CAEBR|nr:Protein CBG23567 [Caenorhabditis briggsae]CAP20391.2 Protein CBG23567 [Caenorhabditis briggsae]